MTPPGGFDAWLHLVAVRVDADSTGDFGAPAGGAGVPADGAGAHADGVRVATASLTAPNDPGDPLALFFIPPVRVEAELRRLLEPLAAACREGAGADPSRTGARSGAAAAPATGTPTTEAGGEGARQPGDPPPDPPPGGGEAGWLLQVGVSGMAYRSLAAAPAGFVPHYRLPRRTLEEPVWVPDEPWWCPCRRLAADPAAIARELAAELVRRLG
ncbi:MAG TPA: hypothetical protein VIL40_03735 [Thermaerobacter sp.]